MSKVVFIKDNSSEIRDKLKEAGFSVCICSFFWVILFKRVADKYNLRIRKRTETLIEQYDLENNLYDTYYSYNDASRFIIENNLDPKYLNIGIVSDLIRYNKR